VRLFLLTLLAFAVRLQLFLSSDEPLGWDGYSYVVQVERLVNEGRLHWPDASWVTYFLAALHLIIPSPVVAVKVGACLLAILPLPWRGEGRGEGMPSSQTRWWLACWVAASPTLTHLAADFPKNLAIVAPLLIVLTWRRSGRLSILLIAALIAALAHRLGAALLFAAGLGALVGALFSKLSDRRVLGVSAVLLLTFAGLSASLPNLLHPADLDRLQTQLTFSPGLPPPLPYFALRETSWPQRIELLLAWPALVLGGWQFFRVKEKRVELGMLLLPLLVCVFPLWRTDSLDVGYRLALMAPMFAVPLLVGFAPRVGTLRLPALVLIALLIIPLSRSGFQPNTTPPYSEWRALISRIPRPLPTLLIAPQGFNFLYDHETGRESLAWSPEAGIARETTFRLAWNIRDGEWAELGEGLEPQPVRLDAQVVFVREDVWERFVERARADGDEELLARLGDWRNPSKVRPRSLQRNH
jgi:hypothetical protein